MTNAWGIAAADVDPEDWPDAADLEAGTIQRRLDAAQRQCAAFAPALPADAVTLPDDLPPGWVLAVVYQARDIHAAAKRPGDVLTVGDGAYPMRVRPLSDTVKAILRPQQGRPVVG